MTNISKKSTINNNESIVLLCGKNNSFNNYGLTKPEIDFIKNEITKKDKKSICVNQLHRLVIVQLIEVKKDKYQTTELLRKAASTIHTWITDAKVEAITVVDADGKALETLALPT